MIPQNERLINQMLTAIYIDKNNPTEYRISFDNVLKILISNNYILPNRQYETVVEDILNKKLVGMPVHHATKFAIAKILIDVADQMSVTKEDLAYASHKVNTEGRMK